MGPFAQRVRFCTSGDGVRIAYSVVGRGPPLVMLSGGHSHLELDPAGPVFGHWIAELARGHSLVRLDTRGFGLSDRHVTDHSIDAVVSDLHAVVDALGLERFALLAWLGGTPFAVTYATRHAQRVSHLVLHASYLRGWLNRGVSPRERGAIEALVRTVESGWEMDDPFVRQTITSSLIPAGSAAQQVWLNEAMRIAAPALAALTARELELLTHMAEGLDNAQIAARLAISEKTVRNHITRVFAKLGVQTRAQAIVFAHDAGLRIGQRSH